MKRRCLLKFDNGDSYHRWSDEITANVRDREALERGEKVHIPDLGLTIYPTPTIHEVVERPGKQSKEQAA